MHSIARILPVLLLASSAALASPIVGRETTAATCIIDGVPYSIQKINTMRECGRSSYPAATAQDDAKAAAFEVALRDCCNKSNGQSTSGQSDQKKNAHVDASEDSQLDPNESNQPQKVPTTPSTKQGEHIGFPEEEESATNAKSGAHKVESEAQQESKQNANGDPILSQPTLSNLKLASNFPSPQGTSASDGSANVAESNANTKADANAKSNGANPPTLENDKKTVDESSEIAKAESEAPMGAEQGSKQNASGEATLSEPTLSDSKLASNFPSPQGVSTSNAKVTQSDDKANANVNGANPPESNLSVPDANADANPSTPESSKKTVDESASVPAKEQEIAKAESGVPKVDESGAPMGAEKGSNANAKVEKSSLEVGSGAPEKVNVPSAGKGPDEKQTCTCPL
ncbi:hypothetical protein MVEN_00518800 [Mycena venus]|uniref:Uncharacterized protein n=1 Tax=Mycena venus TaxID=2733690 RepID=A0A8H6YKV7_9AGAR|nr:hypothetical protein MVEN_00518800 [Mycena venus]